MSMNLNDAQFAILDTLYFVEPFDQIIEESGLPESVVKDELRNLIAARWVQVMAFDETSKDFVRSTLYDADNMRDYHYLATKEGLLKHSGRR
jgi:hypothetical protein